MWDASESVDQADAYGRNLVARAKLTEVEKYNMLRAASVTVAGVKAYGMAKMSKAELESTCLKLYLERIVLDLHQYRNGIGAAFDLEMMSKRSLASGKTLTKRKQEALDKAIKKAVKNNVTPPEQENFSALDCHELFLEIKFESNNTFNPIWVKNLNKNGDIPSGVQLVDLLDKLRLDAFEAKDAQRRIYLDISRKRTAQKKLQQKAGAADEVESGDENESECVRKVNDNTPSKPKVMPDDYIPLHFLPLLKLGPASDNQNPLWIPDTGKPSKKQSVDILLSTENSLNSKSSISRKAQRLEAMGSKESKVLDLMPSGDATDELIRVTLKNTTDIVALLQSVNDVERKNADALVINAKEMYTLNPSEDNRLDYIVALTAQKDLILKRHQPQGPISPRPDSILTPQPLLLQSSPQLEDNYDYDDIGLDLSFSTEYV